MNQHCQHIIFSDAAYNAIMTETFKKDPYETGGILLGHTLDNGIWIVMEVLPPGWRSIFEYAYFEYDVQFVNYLAQNESKKYQIDLQLLGLWHRHPGSFDTFSNTDDGTNQTFASLNPKGAISGIVNIDPRFRLTMYHVANPLKYEKIDIEVGNDLIPEHYFKLKYFDRESGLNPLPPQKKSESTFTENIYEGVSAEVQTTKSKLDINPFSGSSTNIRIKQLFFLLMLLSSIFSVFYYHMYKKISNSNTKEKQQLQQIICHSAGKDLNGFTDEIYALGKLFQQSQGKISAVKIGDTINENQGSNAEANSQHPSANNNRANSSSENVVKKDKLSDNNNNPIRTNMWLLLSTSLFSMLILILPIKTKTLTSWLIVLISFILAILLAFIINSSNEPIISPTFFICTAFGFSLFCFASFLLLSLQERIARFISTKAEADVSNSVYWFQEDSKLYVSEDSVIRKEFSDVERNVENGRVSYFIKTTDTINGTSTDIAFQLVYASDYITNKEIRVYLIQPDLTSLLGDKIKNFQCVTIDNTGEAYLDFSKKIAKGKVNSETVIDNFKEWIKDYNELKSDKSKSE